MREDKHSIYVIFKGIVDGVWEKLKNIFSKQHTSPGLDHQLQVLRLSMEGQEKVIKQLEADKREMAAQYQRLEERLQIVEAETRDSERESFFRELQAILSQIAVMSADLEHGIQIPLEEVLYVLNTIPERLSKLEIERFLKAGQTTEFDPQEHIVVRSDTGELRTGDRVVCIVPGFKYKCTILQKAEVRKEVA